MMVGPSPGGMVIGVEFGTITGGVSEVCGAVTVVVVAVDGGEGTVTTSIAASLT